MPEQLRGVCWDLDHTLVGMRAQNGGATELVARPGITGTLERLAQRGYRHVVTTGGTREYAEGVLAATALRQHITHIFEGAEIEAGAGKRYRPAARSLGLSDVDARQHMLAIGDLVYDQPADIDGLVFLHQPNGFRSESRIVERVIEMLEGAGHGDLSAGFHACLALPEHVTPWLPSGLTLRLELRSPHHPRHWPRLEDILIPTVRLLPDTADVSP